MQKDICSDCVVFKFTKDDNDLPETFHLESMAMMHLLSEIQLQEQKQGEQPNWFPILTPLVPFEGFDGNQLLVLSIVVEKAPYPAATELPEHVWVYIQNYLSQSKTVQEKLDSFAKNIAENIYNINIELSYITYRHSILEHRAISESITQIPEQDSGVRKI